MVDARSAWSDDRTHRYDDCYQDPAVLHVICALGPTIMLCGLKDREGLGTHRDDRMVYVTPLIFPPLDSGGSKGVIFLCCKLSPIRL